MTDLKPLTPAEQEILRSLILQGETLPLETLQRIVLTRRSAFSAIPKEKQSKSRTAKAPPPDEDQLEFF